MHKCAVIACTCIFGGDGVVVAEFDNSVPFSDIEQHSTVRD